jgi:hypothetical protein
MTRTSAMKGSRRNFASPYYGVMRRPEGWVVSVRIYLGPFKKAEDAALAHDRVLIGLQPERGPAAGPLYFPLRKLRPPTLKEIRLLSLQGAPGSGYPYVGIRHKPGRKRWTANLGVRGQFLSLGAWSTPEKAALARDRAVLFYCDRPALLNFPAQAKRLGPASAEALQAEARAEFKTTTSSRFRGVGWHEHTRKWCANISVARRTYRLGEFEDEEEAAKAFDRAARTLLGAKAKLNFPRRAARLSK